jgi:hypothetical protein
MTCNDVNKGTDPNNPQYLLLSQQFNNNWNTQVWIKEDQGYGLYRLKTLWTEDDPAVAYHGPLYLNCDINATTRGVKPLYVKPGDPNASSQKWLIE